MGTESRRRDKKGARPAWLVPLDDPRDEEILSAAFDVFAEKGFHGATMLDVATRARASKETLYAKFKNKERLFEALIAWGCRQNLPGATWLEAEAPKDPRAALKLYARMLLKALLRPESLALYRIAVAEGARLPSVGRILNAFTREPSVALVQRLAAALDDAGAAAIDDTQAFAADFIGFLRGDLYHQVLLGTAAPPSGRQIEAAADRAIGRLLRAYAR